VTQKITKVLFILFANCFASSRSCVHSQAKWAIWWAEGRTLSQEQCIMQALQASQAILSQWCG